VLIIVDDHRHFALRPAHCDHQAVVVRGLADAEPEQDVAEVGICAAETPTNPT
jgi:hypothetical protein